MISPEGEVIRSFVYDLAGRLTEEADANGNATCYEYNRAGWLVRKWEPVEESKEGILYNLTCYAYDKAGNKIRLLIQENIPSDRKTDNPILQYKETGKG